MREDQLEFLKRSMRQILESRSSDSDGALPDAYYDEVAATLERLERGEDQDEEGDLAEK